MSAHLDALRAAGARLSGAGLSPGATGNLSVRTSDGGILCTGTGADLGDLTNEAVSLLNADGTHLVGPRPTKEVPMHVAAYTADDVGAVVHLHSTSATALSCLDDLDPEDAVTAFTPYLTMRAGKVALLPYLRPGHADLGAEVAARIAAGYRCMLLANHGSLIAADTMEAAVAIAVELEESARLQLMLRGMPARALTAEERAQLRP